MAEGMGERPIHGIKEQKERLSDEELGNLLAAIGNNEAKAITLLIMRPGEIYTRGELFKEFLKVQGEDKGWQINPGTLFSYCQESLSPIGLVAKEALNPDLSTYGYSKTGYGKEIGDPIAGLLLDFSLRHPDISLLDLFGHTSSTAKEELTISPKLQFKKRAPIARLAVFRALLQAAPSITEADLLKITHELITFMPDKRGGGLNEHLRSLSEKGILAFKPLDKEGPYSFYRPAALAPEEDPLPYSFKGHSRIRLTRLVWHTIRDNPEKQWSAGEIIQQLIKQDAGMARRQRKGLRSEMSDILIHLHKEGYIDHLSLPRSQITINDTQRGLLSELLTIVDKVKNQDREILETGRKFADRLVVTPDIIAMLLKKAKEHSPHAQHKSILETTENIKTILGRHPNSTFREIAEYLKQDFGKNLKEKSVSEIVREHLRRELVHEINKGVKRFSLAPKVEESTHS